MSESGQYERDSSFRHRQGWFAWTRGWARIRSPSLRVSPAYGTSPFSAANLRMSRINSACSSVTSHASSRPGDGSRYAVDRDARCLVGDEQICGRIAR